MPSFFSKFATEKRPAPNLIHLLPTKHLESPFLVIYATEIRSSYFQEGYYNIFSGNCARINQVNPVFYVGKYSIL